MNQAIHSSKQAISNSFVQEDHCLLNKTSPTRIGDLAKDLTQLQVRIKRAKKAVDMKISSTKETNSENTKQTISPEFPS